jgi:copper chaperone NosL
MKNEGIREMLEGFYRFLGQPLFLWSRPVLVVLVIPLVLAFTLPLWRIELAAPQYPSGLSVDIYAHTITSGHDDKDLREINILNHYIGMKKIERSAFAELDWIPFGLGALAILALRVAAVGDVRALLDLAVIVGYFTAFSGGRFAYKMYVYGHDLSPDAPVKVEPFMPALLGTKQIGNFTTHAEPGTGTYVLTAFVLGVIALALVHLIEGRRRANRQRAAARATP